jgi:hypothetical protein
MKLAAHLKRAEIKLAGDLTSSVPYILMTMHMQMEKFAFQI